MNTILHKSNTRGHANHGWLDAHHSFSFASYYDPTRMHFGVLRVLNDDNIAGGMGFGMHPHDNMEIITIPLEGDLEHQDNMGNKEVIRQNDIQVMSAGTGVVHSEYNANKDKPVKLFQIWLFPNKKNVTPRYQQVTLNEADRVNKLQQILSPNADDAGVWIHQDAWFYFSKMDAGKSIDYHIKKEGNGIYIFVISGNLTIEGNVLETRDGLGISDANKINIIADTDSEILVMEVPMGV
ncbi:MAG: pirin family protein [Bacteroidota bacterium]|nr:pirin family protein [Bacteroidota bacterium]